MTTSEPEHGTCAHTHATHIARMHAYTHTHTNTRTNTHTHTYTHTRIHAYIYIYIYVYIYIYIYICTHICRYVLALMLTKQRSPEGTAPLRGGSGAARETPARLYITDKYNKQYITICNEQARKQDLQTHRTSTYKQNESSQSRGSTRVSRAGQHRHLSRALSPAFALPPWMPGAERKSQGSWEVLHYIIVYYIIVHHITLYYVIRYMLYGAKKSGITGRSWNTCPPMCRRLALKR